MEEKKIPFNRQIFSGREISYIEDSVKLCHISGDGQYSQRCHSFLEDTLGVKRALLTTSCTHALEMAALLLQVQPGDEIIVPSFTFVSTINAFVLRGGIPRFGDIRRDTLTLDPQTLRSLIGSRTKAIVPVHYAGVACEMDEILDIASPQKIAIVEDNAHGLFGRYRGRWLGTIGQLATQSFHETKNFSCGEGGALIINDEEFVERAEILREKGTDRSRYFRGQVDKYTWVDIGSSYLPSDILAAILFSQLERHEEIQTSRRFIWEKYHSHLAEWAEANNITQPFVPKYCEQAYHMYYLIMPSQECRQKLLEQLKMHGVMATFHYLPLHLSPMGRKFGGHEGLCPITEEISERIVRLPFYTSMSESEQDYVIQKIKMIHFN